jgi:hypothetical protein
MIILGATIAYVNLLTLLSGIFSEKLTDIFAPSARTRPQAGAVSPGTSVNMRIFL